MTRVAMYLLLAVFVIPTGAEAQTYEITAELPTLGGRRTIPHGVNNAGQVVGVSRTSAGVDRAFIWDSQNGMRDLGTLGGNASSAQGINNRGEVVGVAETEAGVSATRHAFIWDSTNGIRDLGILGGMRSSAAAINDAGQVVGVATTGAGLFHPFLWDRDNGMQDLAICEATEDGSANDINELAQVAGGCSSGDFIWDSTNGKTDLGTLGEPGATSADALNDSGQVVGGSRAVPGITSAFIWDAVNGMQSLGIADVGADGRSARAINEFGEVVGTTNRIVPPDSCEDDASAFVWDNAEGMRDLNELVVERFGWLITDANGVNDLGTIVVNAVNDDIEFRTALILTPTDTPLPPPVFTDPSYAIMEIPTLGEGLGIQHAGLNNAGQVVGNYVTSSSERAFIWSAEAGIHDIGSLGGSFIQVFGINDGGQAVGASETESGRILAYIYLG